MRRANIVLQNEDKSHSCYITSSQLSTLIEKKSVVRITRRGGPAVYRKIPQPEPLRTIDEFSPPSITVSDMNIFAGLISMSPDRVQEVRSKVDAHEERFRATPHQLCFA